MNLKKITASAFVTGAYVLGALGASAALTVTEVGYDVPSGLPTGEPDYEYFVIYNSGPSSVDLTGYTVSDATATTAALSGTLAADSYLVIANADPVTGPSTLAALVTAWGTTTPAGSPSYIANTGSWPSLNNSGDTVELFDNTSTLVDSWTYSDPASPGQGVDRNDAAVAPLSTITAPVVPEPSASLLGVLGIFALLRRKR